MRFNGWVNTFTVRAKKAEKEVIVVLRADDDELGAEELKLLSNSVSKEGYKCKFSFKTLEKEPDEFELTGVIRAVRVASTVEGRFVQLNCAISELEVAPSDYELLAMSIRSGQEPTLQIDIEPQQVQTELNLVGGGKDNIVPPLASNG